MALTETRERLEQYLSVVCRAQGDGPPGDPVERLRGLLGNRPWVLFGGAGLSCDPPAGAPTFAHLRNAASVAVGQRLTELGIMSATDMAAVEQGFVELDRRDDIELPPEKFFDDLAEALGDEFVHRLLAHSLRAGAPNANHRAIAVLARGSLETFITPNFDEYVEQALAGQPRHRIVSTRDEGGTGLCLYKPHGSLDSFQDIQIRVFDMARPLAGRAREIFRACVERRPVVVMGYSGQDRDLFPLLLHAGRAWGAQIVWLLFDQRSRNHAVAGLQISLGDRCTVIDTAQRPVLAELAGVEPARCARGPDLGLGSLAHLLRAELVPKRREDLIATLLPNIVPAGVAGAHEMAARLADTLLSLAQSMPRDDPRTVLSYVGLAEAYLPDGPRRSEARQLGLELATRWAAPAAVRAWTELVAGNGRPTTAAGRLRRITRELEDMHSGHSDAGLRMAQFADSVQLDLRIERALLLWDIGRDDEAERETRRLLAETTQPQSPVDVDAAVADDSGKWRLHNALAWFEAKAKHLDIADREMTMALELLWREPDVWNLSNTLCSSVSALAQRIRDRALQQVALDLALALDRLANDSNGESVTLRWRRRFGLDAVG